MSTVLEEDRALIARFRLLYGGGYAQHLRESGVAESDAMPPWADTYWLGKRVIKLPVDLWMYQEAITERRPEVILETGTAGGGSAYFFATLFDLLGGDGQVVTVDVDAYPHLQVAHPRITYLVGDSVSDDVLRAMRERAAGKRTMVSLDSLHTYAHVAAELAAYGPLVSPGQYLVVEDVGEDVTDRTWAGAAAADFLTEHTEFYTDSSREKHLLSMFKWLRRHEAS